MSDPNKDPKDSGKKSEGGSVSTTAGIDDPDRLRRINEEREKILEAQRRIFELTGGRKSRAASVASGINPGSSVVSHERVVRDTITATTQPTTFTDRRGNVNVIPTDIPQISDVRSVSDSSSVLVIVSSLSSQAASAFY